MNSREQALAKRVTALEARLHASMVVIDHLIQDLEFTESVGAAFAWDVASDYSNDYDVVAEGCLRSIQKSWDKAVKALEQEQSE